jgi:hypothetical protein
MGLFGFIGKRLYEVVALGRAVGSLVSSVGKKVVAGVKYIGRGIYDLFKAKPKGVIKETIKEVGTGTRNTGRGIIKETAVPKTTISSPPTMIKGQQLTPPPELPPLGNRPLRNPATQLRNVIEDRGYYFGSPQPQRLFKGQLLASDIPAGAKSLPLGNITQRGLGGLTKQQRLAQEVSRIGQAGRLGDIF